MYAVMDWLIKYGGRFGVDLPWNVFNVTACGNAAGLKLYTTAGIETPTLLRTSLAAFLQAKPA